MTHEEAIIQAMTAYTGALKAHIESTSPEQRTWKLARNGGYKIPTKEKTRVRVEASVNAYLEAIKT